MHQRCCPSGFSPSGISDIQKDRYKMPDTQTLMTLAKGVGRRLDDLLVDVDPTTTL